MALAVVNTQSVLGQSSKEKADLGKKQDEKTNTGGKASSNEAKRETKESHENRE